MMNMQSDVASRAGSMTVEHDAPIPPLGRAGRVKLRRATGLEDLLEVLNNEHGNIVSLLSSLEQQSARLKKGKIPDYHLLRDIVHYLAYYPDQYHHPREDVLFSRLLAEDENFKAALERLLREHQTLGHFNEKIFLELNQIVQGRRVNRAELRAEIVKYVEAYRKHLEYESREIFPNAKGTLDTGTLKELAAKTRYIDDPLFGEEVQFQYQRMKRLMQSRVDTASQEVIAREISMIESAIGTMAGAIDRFKEARTRFGTLAEETLREQMDAVRECTSADTGVGISTLPFALMAIHRRQLARGTALLREIIFKHSETGRVDQ